MTKPTDQSIPGYLDARAEIARDFVEERGGRVIGRDKNVVHFEWRHKGPVRLDGLTGVLTIEAIGEDFDTGKIVLDPEKPEKDTDWQ